MGLGQSEGLVAETAAEGHAHHVVEASCSLHIGQQPWLNLLLTREAEKMPALRAFVEKEFPGVFFLQYSSPYYLEVENRLANKGAGALRLRDWLGTAPERFYTVGDGTNDVDNWRLDVLYTVAAIYPDLACRLSGS